MKNAEGEEDPPTGEKCDTLVETGSSELGLRFLTLKAIFTGKSTRQRIQAQEYHM
jgi:hypothetical protein